MANDVDDQISEAISLGTVTTNGKSNSDAVSPDTDVDMYSFSVAAGNRSTLTSTPLKRQQWFGQLHSTVQ